MGSQPASPTRVLIAKLAPVERSEQVVQLTISDVGELQGLTAVLDCSGMLETG